MKILHWINDTKFKKSCCVGLLHGCVPHLVRFNTHNMAELQKGTFAVCRPLSLYTFRHTPKMGYMIDTWNFSFKLKKVFKTLCFCSIYCDSTIFVSIWTAMPVWMYRQFIYPLLWLVESAPRINSFQTLQLKVFRIAWQHWWNCTLNIQTICKTNHHKICYDDCSKLKCNMVSRWIWNISVHLF